MTEKDGTYRHDDRRENMLVDKIKLKQYGTHFHDDHRDNMSMENLFSEELQTNYCDY